MIIKIENLPVKVKQLDEREMRRVFGGATSTINPEVFRISDPMGCALCLNGLTKQLPEGGGDWYVRPEGGGEW